MVAPRPRRLSLDLFFKDHQPTGALLSALPGVERYQRWSAQKLIPWIRKPISTQKAQSRTQKAQSRWKGKTQSQRIFVPCVFFFVLFVFLSPAAISSSRHSGTKFMAPLHGGRKAALCGGKKTATHSHLSATIGSTFVARRAGR